MHYIDIFVADAIFWLLETDYADQLSDEEFAAAVQDRAAFLSRLPYPA